MPLPSHHAAAAGGAPLAPAPRPAIIAAFATLYLVWGSTYLAIRVAVQTAPPFLLAGAPLRRRRHAPPPLAPLPLTRSLADPARMARCRRRRRLPGAAEQRGTGARQRSIPSGVTALFAAGTPLLIALFNGQRTRTSLGPRRAVGLVMGTVGMTLLASATFAAVHHAAPLLLLGLASVAWAVGATYGQEWGQPRDVMTASAVQMLVGGVLASARRPSPPARCNWLQPHTISANRRWRGAISRWSGSLRGVSGLPVAALGRRCHRGGELHLRQPDRRPDPRCGAGRRDDHGADGARRRWC